MYLHADNYKSTTQGEMEHHDITWNIMQWYEHIQFVVGPARNLIQYCTFSLTFAPRNFSLRL